MRTPRSTVFSALILVLLAAAGCGAGSSRTTTTSTRRLPDPPQLATAINHSTRAIDAGGPGVQRAAVTQQLAFRDLADHRSLRRPTLARLTPAARSAAMAALRAADALSEIVPAERRFPDWRIVAPPSASTLRSFFQAAGKTYKIPWQYLAAIELVETRMGRIHGLSPAGAQGPMQFMPATWAEYGHGNINSQRNAIMAAARFLAANGAHRDIGNALLHYNPSRAYVAAVESYAREMRRDRHAFSAFYHWQVLYQTTSGTFLLPTGYPRVRPKRLPG